LKPGTFVELAVGLKRSGSLPSGTIAIRGSFGLTQRERCAACGLVSNTARAPPTTRRNKGA